MSKKKPNLVFRWCAEERCFFCQSQVPLALLKDVKVCKVCTMTLDNPNDTRLQRDLNALLVGIGAFPGLERITKVQ